MEPGHSIAVTLRAAQAVGLARRGKVKEAQTLLTADRAIPEDNVSLEVLAELVTAEGDYLRALRLWEQLLQRDPQHAEAQRMIAAIELWLSRPTWAKFVPLGLATVVGLLILGIVLALTSGPSTPATMTRPTPASAVSPVRSPATPATAPASSGVVSRPTPAPTTSIPQITFPATKTQKKR